MFFNIPDKTSFVLTYINHIKAEQDKVQILIEIAGRTVVIMSIHPRLALLSINRGVL